MTPRPACAGYHTAEGARRAADGASRGTTSPGGVPCGRSAGVTAGTVVHLPTGALADLEDVVRFW